MGSRFPDDLLAASKDWQSKEAQISGRLISSHVKQGNVRHAHHAQIDVIWVKRQATLELRRTKRDAYRVLSLPRRLAGLKMVLHKSCLAAK